MTLIKFRPTSRNYPVFPSMLENFFNNDLSNVFDFNRSTLPAVNISEDGDTFKLDLAAPGMGKNDFKIEVDQKVLRISSLRENQTEEKEGNYSRKEFSYESFQRSFTLPEMADADNISAAYDQGILRVSIPKKEDAKHKPSREIIVS